LSIRNIIIVKPGLVNKDHGSLIFNFLVLYLTSTDILYLLFSFQLSAIVTHVPDIEPKISIRICSQLPTTAFAGRTYIVRGNWQVEGQRVELGQLVGR
jgi:hypothetical protein